MMRMCSRKPEKPNKVVKPVRVNGIISAAELCHYANPKNIVVFLHPFEADEERPKHLPTTLLSVKIKTDVCFVLVVVAPSLITLKIYIYIYGRIIFHRFSVA